MHQSPDDSESSEKLSNEKLPNEALQLFTVAAKTEGNRLASESDAGEVDPTSVDFQPIDPRFIPAERLAALILLIVAVVGSLIACGAMLLTGTERVWMILAASGLFVLCLSLAWKTVFWPEIEYRHVHWRLGKVGLEIRRGVFWKHQIAIPWARAQHADVSQGPMQRIFEISSLTIHTAGTKNSSVTIDGLNYQRAIELRDEIIRQRKEHDVV